MKLTSCRVQNYRSIIDSGWVDFDDIGVIVGKNESGKTSFLKALSKFNPHNKIGYDIDREWPSGRRRDRAADKIVVTAQFSFSLEEVATIENIDATFKGIAGVTISITYAGIYSFVFTPETLSRSSASDWMVSRYINTVPEVFNGISVGFYNIFVQRRETLLNAIRQNVNRDELAIFIQNFLNELKGVVTTSTDEDALVELELSLGRFITSLQVSPFAQVTAFIRHQLPTFVYMDDHRAFVGTAQLDEILAHKNSKRLSPEEETVIIIMEMAGLDLEHEVANAQTPDRQQRILDLHDASEKLTALISDRWSQRSYQVVFQADGQHFITFVKDKSDKALIPLEDRSKGFQWFFSFDMRFMYETNGQFKNAIILLDEPGLHLHASAQRDLLERMKYYAKENQLLYTTHLPFMIDFKRLDNISIAEDIKNEGTRIHKDWAAADKDARFTLQAALGLSWSQSMFVGQFNLVVEGVDDFGLLTTFSSLFEEAGQHGLDQRLVVTPAGGASKVAYVSTILKGQELNVAVLLDSDTAGHDAFAHLVKTGLLKDKFVIMIGSVIGLKCCALEDFFGEKFYLKEVEGAYSKELGGRMLTLDSHTAGKKAICDRISDAFALLGIGEYNKRRVAKKIMTALAKKQLDELDSDSVAKFRKLIDAINSVVGAWK